MFSSEFVTYYVIAHTDYLIIKGTQKCTSF